MIYLITNSKAFLFLNTKFNWCRKTYQFSCRHPDQRDNFRSNRRLLSSTLIVIRWMNASGHKQTKLRVVHYFYQTHSIMIAFAFGLILQLGYRSMLLTKRKRESWDYEQSCGLSFEGGYILRLSRATFVMAGRTRFRLQRNLRLTRGFFYRQDMVSNRSLFFRGSYCYQ